MRGCSWNARKSGPPAVLSRMYSCGLSGIVAAKRHSTPAMKARGSNELMGCRGRGPATGRRRGRTRSRCRRRPRPGRRRAGGSTAVGEQDRDERGRAAERADLDRPEGERQRRRSPRRGAATAGMRNTATWALEASAISAASLIFPRAATMTAPPCSAALPTIATIMAATKKSERPTSSRERLDRADEASSRPAAVTTVAMREDDERQLERPGRHLRRLVRGRAARWWRRSEYQVTPT